MPQTDFDIFDSGWRLPTLDEQALFAGSSASASTWDSTNKGRTFGAKGFLPAAGFRTTDGSAYGIGYYGNYWASVPYSSSYGYNLTFSSGHVGPRDVSNYADGLWVRCVQK